MRLKTVVLFAISAAVLMAGLIQWVFFAVEGDMIQHTPIIRVLILLNIHVGLILFFLATIVKNQERLIILIQGRGLNGEIAATERILAAKDAVPKKEKDDET